MSMRVPISPFLSPPHLPIVRPFEKSLCCRRRVSTRLAIMESVVPATVRSSDLHYMSTAADDNMTIELGDSGVSAPSASMVLMKQFVTEQQQQEHGKAAAFDDNIFGSASPRSVEGELI